MDVFCPNCLHNLTIESRGPGRYTFDCPECAAEAAVTISANPAERPVVRPVRARSAGGNSSIERPGESQARRPRRVSDRDSIDFPFEESDQNLVERDNQPDRDEWQETGDEIPQPLRGAVRKAKTATASQRQQRPAGTPRSVYKWLGAGAAVWLVLVVAGFFVRELAWVPIVLGGLIILGARHGDARSPALRALPFGSPVCWCRSTA